MNYSKSQKYDTNFISENIMGPNPMKLTEELMKNHPFHKGDTIMDLGCGKGVTSIFLAKEYDLRVFATDLWIAPTENYQRFCKFGLSREQIIPIHAEAHDLPYAEEFFDGVVTIDSYHYFGREDGYLKEHLLPLVKHGGYIMIAIPGMREEFTEDTIPDKLALSWTWEDLQTIRTIDYWEKILLKTDGIEIVDLSQMDSFWECWNDWLSCDNEYAVGDRKAMRSGGGDYMNFIKIVLKRK